MGLTLRHAEFGSRPGQAVSRRQRFVRTAILEAFADASDLLQVDFSRLLRKAGLDPDLLAHPEARVAAASLCDLLHLGALASGRTDFALMVAQACRPTMFGGLSIAAQRQATIRDGIESLEQRLKDRQNSLSVTLSRQKDGVVFQPLILDPTLRDDPMAVDLAMGLSLCALRWLLGDGWWPDLACFTYPRPADPAAQRRLFGQLAFDHGFSGLVISQEQLDLPILRTDPGLTELIARYARANALHAGASAVELVLELIARLLPSGQCTIDRVAQQLGVDRRTIHRRLAAEGRSFTDLVEQIRRELIAGPLGEGKRPLTAVADLLGFSSLSTFSRWHRNAFGAAARDYRKSRTSHDPADKPPTAP